MNIKEFISIIGIALCIANSCVMFITFLYAFCNDGYFAIQINLYSEALPELILIPISVILATYGAIRYFKEVVKYDNNE